MKVISGSGNYNLWHAGNRLYSVRFRQNTFFIHPVDLSNVFDFTTKKKKTFKQQQCLFFVQEALSEIIWLCVIIVCILSYGGLANFSIAAGISNICLYGILFYSWMFDSGRQSAEIQKLCQTMDISWCS